MKPSGSQGKRRSVGPAVAGTWYPSNPDKLARQVDEHLAEAKADPRETGRRLIGLIAPHAGYVYSGAVAGRGFGLVRDARYSRVLLLGPSHSSGFRGAALPEAEVYRTPLGEVPLDTSAIASLADHPGFTVTDAPFGSEHSLESEIPFLQRALRPGWLLLPVLLGPGSSGRTAGQLAGELRPMLDSTTLIVVSSDFTHFGMGFGYVPFRQNVPENIRELDMGAVRKIENLDAGGFDGYVNETEATICGRNAISVLLKMLPKDTSASLVAYDTSGNMTGDWGHSVSYAAMAFHRPETGGDE
jgi:AmmeMemoRadiSam system protein B